MSSPLPAGASGMGTKDDPGSLAKAQDIILNEGSFGVSAARLIPSGQPCVVLQLGENTKTYSTKRAREIAAGIVLCADKADEEFGK